MSEGVDRIVSVTAGERQIRLPEPLALGSMRIPCRYYTVVEVACESGAAGVAYAQTRGAPVAETVERLLAPLLLGRDGEAVEERWAEMAAATIAVGRCGLVTRGISLLDNALWDARGKRHGAPVWQLLGAAEPRPVPVMYVAGYPRDRDRVEEIVAAATTAAASGHRVIKVPRTPDPELTRETLERLDASLPPEAVVVVDANWAWGSVDAARAEMAPWPRQRLGWIEDPFVPERADLLAALRADGGVAVAAGDDLTDEVHATALREREAVDVLRLDVAAIGGITAASRHLAAAAARSLPVSFHISPEISIHLATAFPQCRCDIETFDRAGNPFDPSHELIAEGPEWSGGTALAPDRPGLGLTLRD